MLAVVAEHFDDIITCHVLNFSAYATFLEAFSLWKRMMRVKKWIMCPKESGVVNDHPCIRPKAIKSTKAVL